MKGAPSVVLDACTHFAAGNGVTSLLNEDARRCLLDLNDTMAARGLRVLGFANKPLDRSDPERLKTERKSDVESGYVFLGLAGMSDPPRSGVADALEEAHSAGIRTVMLTGDQVTTAYAIASELKLNGGAEISAFNASDILGLSGRELAQIARRADVFARVSPEEKLKIVEALKEAGEIVAVTGDGINDAPALKKADIGIAMGERGTEVAKEAADIVLTDDNFATIVRAIEGGRTIYANIIKFVHLLFSDNLSEVLLIFITILIGLPLPMLPLQILWMNLVTDIFPALALTVEPPSPDTMKRRPRPPGETLLSGRFMFLILWKGVVYSTIALGAYVWALQHYGEGAHARTVALFSLIAVQVGNLFNCRSRTRSAFVGFFRNPFVFAAVGIVIGLQLAAIYLPPISRILDVTQPLQQDWLIIGLCVILPIGIVEVSKLVSGRLRAGKS